MTKSQIFICYDDQDNKWLKLLQEQLKPFEFQNLVEICSVQDIQPGEIRQEIIQTMLQQSKVAVLLVSASFLASQSITNSQLPVLLQRAKDEEVVILPILVSDCIWEIIKFKYPDPQKGPEERSLGSIQMPTTRPLNSLPEHEQDKILAEFTRQLYQIVLQEPMIYRNLILKNRYQVIKRLGMRSLGETWEVDDNGTRKVMKVLFDQSDKGIELFRREAAVLQKLNHPGIPKVDSDGYFIWQSSNSQASMHCLVMEKIEGVNLGRWLEQRNNQPLTEEQAINWLKQLAEILNLVHNKKYIHRDIKPVNIILKSDEKLVLIDFGSIRELTEIYYQEVSRGEITIIYSGGYTPLEQIKGKASSQSDFFALGRTFVHLLTGKYPAEFGEDEKTGGLKENWRDSASHISSSLANLIDDLINPNPEKRPVSAESILLRLHILSLELSIQPVLEQMPQAMRGKARRIFQEQSKRWIQNIQNIQVPRIALYGRAGVGKSSLINAILGERRAPISVATVGTIETESHDYYRQGWKLRFVDSRGVGDAENNVAFDQAINDIVQEKVDILLFAVPVKARDIVHDIEFLRQLKRSYQQKYKLDLPVILVLNKIDEVPPRGWNPPYNLSLELASTYKSSILDRDQKKEDNIRACIKARMEKYQELTQLFVPVCTLWDDDDDARYNIEALIKQIYDCIPDEAAKNGFGGATADKSLKKAIANDLTSTAAWLACFTALIPFSDANTVLSIQNSLINMIARLSKIEDNQNAEVQKFLRQLGIQRNDAKESALPITLALGKAALRYFLDGEEINGVKQNYEREEKRSMPEIGATPNISEIEKTIKLELSN